MDLAGLQVILEGDPRIPRENGTNLQRASLQISRRSGTGVPQRRPHTSERVGLVSAARSASGYRLYGPVELQRLRTLRELLRRFGIDLGEVGFALRLHREPQLREAIESWLSAEATRPENVPPSDWLSFEQEKHQRLLVAPIHPTTTAGRTPVATIQEAP